MMVATGMVLTACQPTLIKGPEAWAPISEQTITEGLTFSQYADKECTTPQEDGNYIKYTSANGVVQWYMLDASGAENILGTGAAGVIQISPKRKSDPKQTAYARWANPDGTVSQISHEFTVYVPADLSTEMLMMVGEEGEKVWMWDYNATTGSTCWGNGGASSGSDYDNARTVGGHWWGVTYPSGLLDQLQHTGGDVPTGAEDSLAYMLLNEDNQIASYTSDGDVISEGTYKLEDYDATRASGWQIAKLRDPKSAVLFPYSINEGGKLVTDFDVMYLDPNHMTLVYTKGNAAGSWGEITHWMFKNGSDAIGAFTANDERKWGWASDGYEIWGNAGNSGGGSAFGWNNVDGKWWGVTSATGLLDQLQHSPTGIATGEEDDDAYMIFSSDGNVTTYDAAGNEIRSGKFEVETYDERNNGWELGKVKTSSTLFPFSINEGGVTVTEFDLMYLDGDNMTLVYTKGNGSGSWGEITYWRFEAKE